MTDSDNLIEAILSLFIVFLLGYVFFIILSALSLGVAILFAIVIAVAVGAILLRLFRG